MSAWIRIPSLEEIYNEFHKQSFFALKGIYPRSIKNFDKVLSDNVKREYLLRFQNFLKRNNNLIDWKIYIKANAEILKGRFQLKVLGTLAATKIYKNYIIYLNKNINTEDFIYNDIIRSLQFLNICLKENNFTFETYLLDNKDTLPTALKHLYSDNVSLYFYAAFSNRVLNSFFKLYHDDCFYELFEMDKLTFINNVLSVKRLELLKFSKVCNLVEKLEQKFLINNSK